MPGKCANHPSKPGAETIDKTSYCADCVKQIKEARKDVDKHVSPKDCFVEYAGTKKGFVAISGTGCAHWVAHEQGLTGGSQVCHAGYTMRVRDIIKGRKKIDDLADVKKGDIWASDNADHCGLVDSVKKGKKDEPPDITIEHCSSRQGGVRKNGFADYFKGKGAFYR